MGIPLNYEERRIRSMHESIDRVISREPILESMTTMAALAGRTRRLKFGFNVVSMALREPVLLAMQCASTLAIVLGAGYHFDQLVSSVP